MQRMGQINMKRKGQTVIKFIARQIGKDWVRLI